MNECKLCNVWKREPDNVYFHAGKWVVIRTLNLKGHKQRIQIVLKEHREIVTDDEIDEALKILVDLCKQLFHYTYKVVIMDSTHSKIRDHFHLVATDLNPLSEDFEQILYTPWLRVVDTNKRNKNIMKEAWI